jgi:hypothetical protein
MRRPGVLLALTLATACGDEPAPTARAEPRLDTAVIDLTIGGGIVADPDATFGRIGGLALGASGEIVVADAQANELRAFSAAGDFRFRVGRAGAGPGEFDGPCCLAFGDDGNLWVRDGGNARYEVSELGDTAAAYVGSVRMAHGDVNRRAPVTFDTQGRLIDIGYRPGADGEPRTFRMHLDPAGEVVASTPVHAAPAESTAVHEVPYDNPAGGGVRYFYQPYGPGELIAHSPAGGYAYALSSRYAISWFDDEGTVVREVAGDVADGPLVSEAERLRAEAGLDQQASYIGRTRAALPFDIPARKPPLRRLFFDLDGRLWVQRNVAEGEPALADVYDPAGRRAKRVTWPAAVDLSMGIIRGGVALGVARDELDIERVVRLRIGRND